MPSREQVHRSIATLYERRESNGREAGLPALASSETPSKPCALTLLPECLVQLIVDFGGLHAATCRALAAAELRYLCFAACAARVRDDELAAVAAVHPAVVSVRLHHGIACTDAGVTALARQVGARLRVLDVTSTFGVTDGTLRAVAAACPALERLVFSGCGKCSDRGLRSLAGGAAARAGRLTSLAFESFNYSWDFVTDRGLRHLSAVASLTALNMSGNNGITVKGLMHLAKCPLVSVALRGCEQCDDGWLRALAAIPTLRFVDARKNHRVSPFPLPGRLRVLVDAPVANDGDDARANARGFEDVAFGHLPRDARVFGVRDGEFGGVFGGVDEAQQARYRPDKVGCYK